MKSKLSTLVISLTLILLVWEIGSVVINRYFLPSPVESLSTAAKLLSDGSMRRDPAGNGGSGQVKNSGSPRTG